MWFLLILHSKKEYVFQRIIARCDVKRYFTRFQRFLHGYGFAPEKNISYTTLWVSRFLVFFNEREDQGARALIPESLNSLTTEHNTAEWQVRQAEEVLRLYLIIMKAGTLQELRKLQRDGIGENTLLEAMKTRIKIKHYSYAQNVHTSTGEAFSSIPGTDKKKGQGFVCEPDRYKELLELPGSATECIVSHAKPGVLRPYPVAQLCHLFVDEQCKHQGDSGPSGA